MNSLEWGMYEVSRLFLAPTLILILAALGFAMFALGSFLLEGLLRARGRYHSPVLARWQRDPDVELPDLELVVLRQLEALRITSRAAPMLGLVATMIPMGPALMALGDGSSRGVSENLVGAFAAVMRALVAAAISFLVLTVRRRWLLGDLRGIERRMAAGEQSASAAAPSVRNVVNA